MSLARSLPLVVAFVAVALVLAAGAGDSRASTAAAAVYDQEARHLLGLARSYRRLARGAPSALARRIHRRRARSLRRRALALRRKAVKARGRRVVIARAPRPAAPPPPQRGPPRPLGTAVSWSAFQADPALQSVFLRNFDSMTPENEMKMDALQPVRGRFRFARADELVNWSIANGKSVRGHTLIWGNQLPLWVEVGIWTPEELREVMREHITTVVGHFKGRVREWDVVNEAFSWPQRPWQGVLGTSYVEDAFRIAHRADPQARLFYNDNGIDMPDDPHTQRVLRMVADFKRRGVPIHGVGMQNHVSSRYHAPPTQLAETMRRFRALGVEVAVTEMDVRLDRGASEAERRHQSRVYAGYAATCRLEPRCSSFTVWGMSDRDSWFDPLLEPLLFDRELRPKPAYGVVSDLLRRP